MTRPARVGSSTAASLAGRLVSGLLVGVRRLGLGLRLRPRGPIPLDEGREHVIERRPLLASALDLATARPDGLDDVRQGRPSVVDDDGDAPRTVLADAA